MSYNLSNHFEEDMILIEKFNPKKIISAVYFDASSDRFYLKRFLLEGSNNINKKVDFKGEHDENYLLSISMDWLPQVKIIYDAKANNKELADEIINVAEFIGIKSPKAKGKRLTAKVIKKIEFIEPLPYDEPKESVDSEDEQLIKTEDADSEKPKSSKTTKKQGEEKVVENPDNKTDEQLSETDEDDTQQMELEF